MLCKTRARTNSTRKPLFIFAHFHTVSSPHVQMLFPSLRPWRGHNAISRTIRGAVKGPSTASTIGAFILKTTKHVVFLTQLHFAPMPLAPAPRADDERARMTGRPLVARVETTCLRPDVPKGRKQDAPSGTTANTSVTSTNQKSKHQKLKTQLCRVLPKIHHEVLF